MNEAETRAELIDPALERGLPLPAICRGPQVPNVALGGTLWQHLPDTVGEQVMQRMPPGDPTRHRVRVDAGTRCADILGVAELEKACPGTTWACACWGEASRLPPTRRMG